MLARLRAFVRSLYWFVNGLLFDLVNFLLVERGLYRPRPFTRPPRKSPPAAVLFAVLVGALPAAAQETDPVTELRRELAESEAADVRQADVDARWRAEVVALRDAVRVADVGGDGAAVLRAGQPLDEAQTERLIEREAAVLRQRRQAAREAVERVGRPTGWFTLSLGGAAGGVGGDGGEVDVSPGGFVEGSLAGPLIGVYFGGSRFDGTDLGGVRVGLKVTGPPGWAVRPTGRFGGLFAFGGDMPSRPTFGGGLETGRAFGAVLTLDVVPGPEAGEFGGELRAGAYWRVPF